MQELSDLLSFLYSSKDEIEALIATSLLLREHADRKRGCTLSHTTPTSSQGSDPSISPSPTATDAAERLEQPNDSSTISHGEANRPKPPTNRRAPKTRWERPRRKSKTK